MHDDKYFKKEWSDYWSGVSREIGKPIVGTTYGQAPSFSSFVVLKEEKGKNFSYLEELHFSVSFVGPFYTIIGQTQTEVHYSGDPRRFKSVNKVTSSPTPDSTECFNLVAKKIESKYPGYMFVPYHINAQFIEGLRVRYRDEKRNRVYHALFNDLIDFEARNAGDKYFKPN